MSEKTSRRKFLKYGVTAVVAAAAAGTVGWYAWNQLKPPQPSPKPYKDTLKIGYAIAFTGDYATVATTQRDMYTLWQEQINAEGGIYIKEYGKKVPIEFVFYDDKGENETAVVMYEKLVEEDKVDFLLPPWGTSEHFALIPLWNKYGYPVVGLTANTDRVYDLVQKYYFQTIVSRGMARGIADFIKAHKDVYKSVAVLYTHSLSPLEVAHDVIGFMEEAEIPIVLQKDYPLGVKDLTPVLLEVRDAKPDALICGTYPPDSFIMTQNLIELNYVPNLFYMWLGGFEIGFYDKFKEQTEANMGCAANRAVPTNSVGYERIFKPYRDRFGYDPGTMDAGNVWIGLEIFRQALEKAQTLDRDKVRDVIATETFDTVAGMISFNGKQVAPEDKVCNAVIQWQGGKPHQIWPPEYATADPILVHPPWRK